MSNEKIPKTFFVISMIFGIIFSLIVPPFNSPDENNHFLYAYQMSRGNFFPTTVNNISGYYVPKSIMNYIDNTKQSMYDENNVYNYNKIFNDQLLSQDYSEQIFSTDGILTNSKISYIAPAIGIQITDYIPAFDGTNGKVSVAVMVQFARFFSLLVYSILCYLALKITPKFKKSFFCIMLLPFSTILRGMVTYDSLILAVVALTLAYILKFISDNDSKFSKKHFIVLTILGFILLNVKTVYFIVFAGFLAIPYKVFGTKKDKISTIFKLGLSIFVLSVISKIPYSFVKTAPDILKTQQIQYIIHNPIQYTKLLFKTMFNELKVQDYWMIGTFGNLDTYMPVLFVFLMKIYLIIIFSIEAFTEKIIISKWMKIGYLLLIILAIIGIYTVMYFGWTAQVTGVVGGNIIVGVQGRYFIPFLFLIPIIFNNNFLNKIKKYKKINIYLDKFNNLFLDNFHYITVASLILSVIFVFIRYYC